MLNALLKTSSIRIKQIIGLHGCGIRNNNGSTLIALCPTFQLVIGGSVFPHKEIHKYTWTSPNRKTQNQIDHICVSQKWRGSLLDVRNKREANLDSDHELVIGDIKINLKCIKKANTLRRHNRLCVKWLRNPTTRKEFSCTLNEKLLACGKITFGKWLKKKLA